MKERLGACEPGKCGCWWKPGEDCGRLCALFHETREVSPRGGAIEWFRLRLREVEDVSARVKVGPRADFLPKALAVTLG